MQAYFVEWAGEGKPMEATGAITDGVAATTVAGCSRSSWGCCWVVGYPCAVEKVFVLF